MPAFELVEIGAAAPLLAAAAPRRPIGVDTEFVREKTFFAELCLVQVAAGDDIIVVDPLADGDADSFWRALNDRAWVVHAGRQDLEVIFQNAKRLPDSLFDTQIAAALLGFPPQLGYATLVDELFDVSLAKTHTRADWSRRPLPEEFVEYAAEDVEFLLAAHDLLTGRLERAGRMGWAEQDSRDLLDPSLYRIDAGSAVDRLKAARNLSGSARAAAAGLAAWREREAQQRNRPRQWILKDAVLLEVARMLPATITELASVAGFPERTIRRASREILGIVASAKSAPADYSPPPRPDEKQKALLKRMQAAVARIADELGIVAEVIASRKDLTAALIGDRDGRLFRGWRRDVVGAKLLNLLD